MELDQQVIEVLKRLEYAGLKAYVVGGYIRDLLLKKKSFDVDICFSGDVDEVMNALSEYEFDLSAQIYGAVSFKIDAYQFECTHLRMEEGSTNHRHPENIVWTDKLEDDLKRRDLTINTICYSLEDGLIDMYHGTKDLKEGIIRVVGDPEVRFDEDYLRVFRVLRFQSHYGFEIEQETEEAMKQVFLKLKDYPVVWWQKEFEKLLLGKYFIKTAMAYPAFFDALFGYFMDAYRFDQRNPYHEYCLYEHSMKVVQALPTDSRLKLAGLFHDLGKLSTEVHDAKGVSHYQGHAEVSYQLSLPILEKFTMKAKDRRYVLDLIRYHGIKMEAGFSTMYQLCFKYGKDFMKDLVLLKRADNLSKSSKAYYQVEKCDAFLDDYNKIEDELWPLDVSDLKVGYQECKQLGVKQNQVAKTLDSVLKEVVFSECGNDKQRQVEILKEVVSHGIH